MASATISGIDSCGYGWTKFTLAFVFGRGKATHVELLVRTSSPNWAASAGPAKAHASEQKYAAMSLMYLAPMLTCRVWFTEFLVTCWPSGCRTSNSKETLASFGRSCLPPCTTWARVPASASRCTHFSTSSSLRLEVLPILSRCRGHR